MGISSKDKNISSVSFEARGDTSEFSCSWSIIEVFGGVVLTRPYFLFAGDYDFL